MDSARDFPRCAHSRAHPLVRAHVCVRIHDGVPHPQEGDARRGSGHGGL